MHNVAAAHRVLDALAVVEDDPAVRVVLTCPVAVGGGGSDLLRHRGAPVIPWEQAEEERFDLVVSASARQLDRLSGPILLLPGVSTQGVFRGSSHHGDVTDIARAVGDGSEGHPWSVVALAHDRDRQALLKRWSGAVRHAVVAGDPGFDRLVASAPLRDRYRAHLGLPPDRAVVLLTSAYEPRSPVTRSPSAFQRLAAELSTTGYLVLIQIHPDAWDTRGSRYLRAWVAHIRRSDVILTKPTTDLRIPVVAADRVVGDHGLVTAYAVAAGKPVLLARPPATWLEAGSLTESLVKAAPTLDRAAPLQDQLDRARESRTAHAVVSRITSLPHHSAAVLRNACYRALNLPDSATPGVSTPIPVHRTADFP
ncbi:hypothetical protein [Saccharothrix obliqua]|uniref:hypothetical protein n=1 Tax=Saccharothrix obliqua TaxID=2861747 RepID=UPI001C5CEC70|nr:hypothetical protein [Saccharothrix obliqua]MBW4720339.1 hypothetical protein [Saccharothrix obliqua]